MKPVWQIWLFSKVLATNFLSTVGQILSNFWKSHFLNKFYCYYLWKNWAPLHSKIWTFVVQRCMTVSTEWSIQIFAGLSECWTEPFASNFGRTEHALHQPVGREGLWRQLAAQDVRPLRSALAMQVRTGDKQQIFFIYFYRWETSKNLSLKIWVHLGSSSPVANL